MSYSQRAALLLLSLLITCTLSAQPPGFNIEEITDEVPAARQLAEASNGILFVGSFRDKVYAVELPQSPDGEVKITVVAESLRMPTGVALHDGDLYVAALNEELRFDYILDTYGDRPEPVIITDDLPSDRHHGWKYLTVGPDNHLYMNIGAPCNICKRENEAYASIIRMDPADGSFSVYAHGVRNSVGQAWHPVSKQLWFSENGGDMMGDDVPAEEINVVTESGQHFGYPHVHQGDLLDRQFGQGFNVEDFVPPTVNIQAHSAAIGMDFYTGDQFPEKYKNALFIAEHGSWNRSSKVGYRVSVVRFEGDEPIYEPFIDIWLKGETATGRPADVLTTRSGDLLISDDAGSRIYKVTYD